MVVARRLSDVGIFKITPQQSDYMSAWGLTKNPSASVSRRKRSAKSVVAKFLPRAIKKPLKRMITGRSEAFQSDAYRRV